MCVKWQGREWEKPIPKLWELEGNEKSQQSGTGRESKRSNTKIPTKGSRRESSSWCSSKNFTLSRYDPPSRHNHYLLFGRTHHFHFPPDLKLILHHFKKICLATASEKERHNETGHMHRSQRLSEEMSQLKKSEETKRMVEEWKLPVLVMEKVFFYLDWKSLRTATYVGLQKVARGWWASFTSCFIL